MVYWPLGFLNNQLALTLAPTENVLPFRLLTLETTETTAFVDDHFSQLLSGNLVPYC